MVATRFMVDGRSLLVVVASLAVAAAMAVGVARAEVSRMKDVLSAVVKVTTEVPAEARTAAFLGTRREGSGVVIDGDGLVLTIGYLILESSSAEIHAGGKTVAARYVAYDHATGFGLLRATRPLGVKALEFGHSGALAERDQVLVVSYGGRASALGAYVVSRRDFAGSWEYLLDNAIFTAPPHPQFGGAALIDDGGRLVGIGSLIVPNAAPGANVPGNMFVPIDRLKPILADLLTKGRSAATALPWLGLYPEEVRGRLFVSRAGRRTPPASGRATWCSASPAKRSATSRTTTARSGRWAPRASRCRSWCCAGSSRRR